MILINVMFPIRPEKTDEWLELADYYTKAVNAEPGCLYFKISRDLEDENNYVTVEGFVDGEAGGEHMKQDHVARFMSEMPALVSARPQIIYIDNPDTPGWGDMGEITPAEG